jgi:phage terminase large subunit-like protein
MLDISVPSSYLENEVIQSIGMPARQNLTRRLNFCEWVDSASPFVDPDIWRANGDPPGPVEGMACVGALDLSDKNDLSTLVLRFSNGAVVPYFWTPEEGLRQREDQDRAPYAQWVREGYLHAVPGKIIEYRWIARTIGDIKRKYKLHSITFDRWGLERFQLAMKDEGVEVDLVPHGQGFKDMSPSIQALEDALMTRQLRHNNHPILTWCMNNAQVEIDPAGNRKFTKRKATGRIDGAVALAMVEGLFALNPTLTSQEPQFFVL